MLYSDRNQIKNLKLSNLLLVALIGLLTNCASTPKVESLVPVQPDKTDFVMREHYPQKIPAWAEDFETYKRANDSKGGLYYFLGESGDVNDRIQGCEVANLLGKKKIAEQIAQVVNSKIGFAKAGVINVDKDVFSSTELGSDFQNVVAAESLAFLNGVQEYGKYWEERDYSATGGRKRVYQCQSLVVIDDLHLREAIQRTRQKVGSAYVDPVARGLVNSAFDKLDHGFAETTSKSEENSVASNSGVNTNLLKNTPSSSNNQSSEKQLVAPVEPSINIEDQE